MRYLMLDRIIQISDLSAIGYKTCSMSEDYLIHHFRNYPIMPGVLVLESMVQLAAWTIWNQTHGENWAILSEVNSVKYLNATLPGDRIQIEVSLDKIEDSYQQQCYRASGICKSDTITNCQADFLLNAIRAEDVDNSEDLKLLYRTLTRERYVR